MPLDLPLGAETAGYTISIDGKTYRPLLVDASGRLYVLGIGTGGAIEVVQDTPADLKAAVHGLDGTTQRQLKVDSEGRLLTVAASPDLQSAVQVNRSAVQSIPASTWTKIQFNGEVFDILGEWDPTTNYRFTAQAAGRYQVSGSIHMASIDANKTLAVWVYVNGVGGNHYAGPGTMVVTEDVYFPLAVLLNLAAGDYVELYVYHTSAAARNTGTTRCIFSIVRVQ